MLWAIKLFWKCDYIPIYHKLSQAKLHLQTKINYLSDKICIYNYKQNIYQDNF